MVEHKKKYKKLIKKIENLKISGGSLRTSIQSLGENHNDMLLNLCLLAEAEVPVELYFGEDN